ncbi:flavin reductase [Micromonospora sp. NPDC049662]|uniref:flavin reductase n=1 Tax=Micromonospora sp. NPDC049662 TaxID=3155397 RepID=UPI00341AA99B
MGEIPTTVRAARALQAERSVAALDGRMAGEHLPRRPQWDCLACEQDWPCDPARVRLAEAYGDNRINLAMYVGSLLFVATAELPDADPADLHERFVAWTR